MFACVGGSEMCIRGRKKGGLVREWKPKIGGWSGRMKYRGGLVREWTPTIGACSGKMEYKGVW